MKQELDQKAVRTILCNDQSVPAFYVVWSPNNDPLFDTFEIHAELKEARDCAARRATQQPGLRFFILQCDGIFTSMLPAAKESLPLKGLSLHNLLKEKTNEA